MVMIIFKDLENQKADISLSIEDDFENYGKELFCQYAYKRESLSVAVENMLPQQVQKLAFGAMLADYSFDKYLNKRADEYLKLESISFCSNKNKEIQQGFEEYTALANAIRFAKDLYNEPEGQYQTEQYFFEIKRLEYLGINFKDCGDNLLRLGWRGSDKEQEKILVAQNRKASSVVAGIVKVAALQSMPINLLAYLKIENNLNDLFVKNPIYIKDNINNETAVEQELRRVYDLIKEV